MKKKSDSPASTSRNAERAPNRVRLSTRTRSRSDQANRRWPAYPRATVTPSASAASRTGAITSRSPKRNRPTAATRPISQARFWPAPNAGSTTNTAAPANLRMVARRSARHSADFCTCSVSQDPALSVGPAVDQDQDAVDDAPDVAETAGGQRDHQLPHGDPGVTDVEPADAERQQQLQ